MRINVGLLNPILGRPGFQMLNLVAVLTAGVWQASAQSSLSLSIDPATTTLLQNTSGQVVRVLLQNTGPAFPVIGGTFHFQIDDGDSLVNPAPVITSVSIVDITGNPFTSTNVDPTAYSTDGEFWDVSFTTLLDPSSVTPVNLPAGPAQYTFAEVTVDTTGFNTGQWDFKIINTVSGNPFFTVEDPGDPTNVLTEYPSGFNGTLQIGAVPIPEVPIRAGGISLLGWALLSSLWRRRAAVVSARPELS